MRMDDGEARCQSCGMPLARDEQGGGTEADGSRSAEYCSHCYQDGKFTMPDLTPSQMAERVADRLRSLSISESQIASATESIEMLRRWSMSA